MVSPAVRNMQSADQRQRVEGIGCFDSRSFLKSSSTFQNFFTFALLSSSSALLQTPKCVEYQPSALFPAVSSPLTSSSYPEPTPCFCPRCYLSSLKSSLKTFFFFFEPFLQSHCSEVRVCVVCIESLWSKCLFIVWTAGYSLFRSDACCVCVSDGVAHCVQCVRYFKHVSCWLLCFFQARRITFHPHTSSMALVFFSR